jgi:phosphatidylinositol kinase/protein kinase (PI-3  family)
VQKNEKATADGENEEGRKALLTIRGKLGGQINKEELPLSAEGQVDELIRMAVAPERLVAMYIGMPRLFTLISSRMGCFHVIGISPEQSMY